MKVLFRQCAAGMAGLAILLFAGCSRSNVQPAGTQSSQAAAKAEAPPQIVPGKTAFWPMYKAAHGWASDVIVLRLTAKELTGYKNQDGKAGMWEAVFASPSLHQYRTYTYSIADVPPNIFKGVDAGLAMNWGGITRDAMPVDLSLFNVDSDAAYKAAAGDAAEWLKKNPDKEVTTLEVGDTSRFNAPVWYVMWGAKKAGYAAFVDANTGNVLKLK